MRIERQKRNRVAVAKMEGDWLDILQDLGLEKAEFGVEVSAGVASAGVASTGVASAGNSGDQKLENSIMSSSNGVTPENAANGESIQSNNSNGKDHKSTPLLTLIFEMDQKDGTNQEIGAAERARLLVYDWLMEKQRAVKQFPEYAPKYCAEVEVRKNELL